MLRLEGNTGLKGNKFGDKVLMEHAVFGLTMLVEVLDEVGLRL